MPDFTLRGRRFLWLSWSTRQAWVCRTLTRREPRVWAPWPSPWPRCFGQSSLVSIGADRHRSRRLDRSSSLLRELTEQRIDRGHVRGIDHDVEVLRCARNAMRGARKGPRDHVRNFDPLKRCRKTHKDGSDAAHRARHALMNGQVAYPTWTAGCRWCEWGCRRARRRSAGCRGACL